LKHSNFKPPPLAFLGLFSPSKVSKTEPPFLLDCVGSVLASVQAP
jgi:hypothetical protein